MRAAVALLDEEIREAVLGTASTALGANLQVALQLCSIFISFF